MACSGTAFLSVYTSIVVGWVVTPSGLVDGYKHFGAMYVTSISKRAIEHMARVPKLASGKTFWARGIHCCPNFLLYQPCCIHEGVEII